MEETISKNMLSVYLTNVIPAGTSFVFWIIVTNYTGSVIIGTVVALTSFAFVLGTISGFDTSIGVRGFLGKAKTKNNWQFFKQISFSTVLFNLITSAGICVFIFNPFFNILDLASIDQKYAIIVAMIIIANGLINILTSVLISALRSDKLIIPYSVAAAFRFPVLFGIIVFLTLNETTVAWSYASLYVVSCIFLLVSTFSFLKTKPGSFLVCTAKNIKIVLHASLAKWIPTIISVLGAQLSILVIFSEKGAAETGLYYISFAIYNVVHMVPGSIITVIHPVLSGMEELEKQRKFLHLTLKIGFLMTMPIAAVMIFFAGSVVSIFGSEFIVSKNILTILLLSLPLIIIVDGVFFLFYARSNYRTVLILGLAGNIPRIIAYFILVPIYGAEGGAISYVIGTIGQLVVTLIMNARIGLNLKYVNYFAIAIIPLILGLGLDFLEIGVISIPMIILFSLIIYTKVNLLDENDIEKFIGLFVRKDNISKLTKQIVYQLKRFRIM